VAETPKTHGPPIVSSSVKVKAGGQPTIPELQAVLGGMGGTGPHVERNAWEVGAGRIMGRLTFEANGDRLSSAGLTLDPEDEETARFHACDSGCGGAQCSSPRR
jgi:hypothetical protein